MSFFWFDILAVVVLLAFAAISWFKGFIKEAFSAASWLGGYFGAAFFYTRLSKTLQGHIGNSIISDIVSYVSLYAGIYILARLAGWLVYEKLGLKNVPNYVDRPAGGLMGALKAVLLISAVLIPLNYFPAMKSEFMEKSYAARLSSGISELCYPLFGFSTGKAQLSATVPAGILEGGGKAEEMLKGELNKVKDSIPASLNKLSIDSIPKADLEKLEKDIAAATVGQPPLKSVEIQDKLAPVLKKADPVVKHKAEPANEGTDMDTFVKSLR